MKDPLLLVLLALVGIFLYFVSFKGVIYPFLLLFILLFTALWYVLNNYISLNMVKKLLKNEECIFQRAQMVDEEKNELINGALIFTKSEIIFCKRKSYKGGLEVLFSVFTSTLASYTFDYCTEKKKGIITEEKNGKKKYFVSQNIRKREKEIEKILSWG